MFEQKVIIKQWFGYIDSKGILSVAEKMVDENNDPDSNWMMDKNFIINLTTEDVIKSRFHGEEEYHSETVYKIFEYVQRIKTGRAL